MKATPESPSENTGKPALSKRKKLVFKIIALLLPFFLIGLVEGGLRLLKYGHDFSLFVEDVRPGYWVMNPHISEKYFLGTDNATIGNFEPFQKQKEKHTFRIFVLGASTAIGYPYLHNGSFHRWLQYRLSHTFPDTYFEVINLSLTAVNTYTLLDFARQLPPYAPDAILIYTGHNEYYGALGVGATNFIGSSPHLVRWVLKLRDFRIVQGFTNIWSSIRKKLSGDAADLRENLMKRMAEKQKIPYESEIYRNGIRQYATNLEDVLKIFDRHQIPVFISNLVSNEKDLLPFMSDTTDQEASAIHYYTMATRYYEQEDYHRAKELYAKAKELDLLRFRAPAAMNSIIRQLANHYENVFEVDTKTVFEQHSPNGIIGEETLLEHVHPNLLGYALLSDAFYEALRKEKMIADEWDTPMSFETLREKMPVTIVDSLKGAYEMMILKSGWPFNEPMPPQDTIQKTLPEALAGGLVVKQISWEAAMEKLYQHYHEGGNYRQALKVAEAVILEHPYEAKYYTVAARLCMRLKSYDGAAKFYKQAFALHPSAEYAKKIAIDLVKVHELEESLPYLSFLENTENIDRASRQLAKVVKEILSLQRQWQSDRDNVQVLHQMAFRYAMIGHQDTARWFLNKVLELDPAHQSGAELLAQLNQESS